MQRWLITAVNIFKLKQSCISRSERSVGRSARRLQGRVLSRRDFSVSGQDNVNPSDVFNRCTEIEPVFNFQPILTIRAYF